MGALNIIWLDGHMSLLQYNVKVRAGWAPFRIYTPPVLTWEVTTIPLYTCRCTCPTRFTEGL